MKKNIIIFKGGSIYTADKAQSRAEAVIVEGDTIVYVGDEAGAEWAWYDRYRHCCARRRTAGR